MAVLANRNPNGRSVVGAGVVAGVIGGIAMAMLAMFVALANGQGFWTPLYLIAGLFWGVNALVAGPGAAFVGLIIHMMVSAVFGVVFALIVQRPTTQRQVSPGVAFWGGMAYGFVVWAFMNYLILPWSNPTMNARVNLMSGWFFIEHLAFGAMLFLTPILTRAFSRGQPSADLRGPSTIRRAA